MKRAGKEQVLRAVRAAQTELGRAVGRRDVVEWLERRTGEAFSPDAVGNELNRLFGRGTLESPGKTGAVRTYRIPGTRVAHSVELARWMRVLEAVRKLCDELSRPVRMHEIQAAAFKEGIPQDEVTIDVGHLAKHGHLKTVCRVISDGGGSKCYLPDGWTEANGPPEEMPLTPLGVVAEVFRALWFEAEKMAQEKEARVMPISTGMVRERLRATHPDHSFLGDPQLVVNAMKQLAVRSDPVVRMVRRPGRRMLLWAPTDTPDDVLQVAGVWASDSERVMEAVARAQERHQRPVTMGEILAEEQLDRTLVPIGGSTMRAAIYEASRETLAGADGERVPRRQILVRRLGRLNRQRYYATADHTFGNAWVDLKAVWRRISSGGIRNEIERASKAQLPGVAAARIRNSVQILSDLTSVAAKIANEEGIEAGLSESAKQAVVRLHEILCVAREHLERLSPYDESMPASSPTQPIGWTWSEVKRRFANHHKPSHEAKTSSELSPGCLKLIARVENPRFLRRSHPDPRQAAERLYDPTTAMFFAARNWGGPETRTVASAAIIELGPLRDPHAVALHLQDPEENTRRLAVACLSVLPHSAARKALEKTAIEDSDPTIRDSALLGIALGVAPGSRTFLQQRATDDEDPKTQEWAALLAETDFRDVVTW